jgi:Bromodomain
VFEEEVTDKEAPGYSDVVKFPMDFGTMRKKVKNGEYGTGSEAAALLYKDFRQVFDNCYLYNDEDNEVTTEAIRVLSYLPEAYVAACVSAFQAKK